MNFKFLEKLLARRRQRRLEQMPWRRQVPAAAEPPVVGQEVYVPGEGYIDHGEDDVIGGKATIAEIRYETHAGRTRTYVLVRELPGDLYEWNELASRQEALRAGFGEARAHWARLWSPERGWVKNDGP